MTETFAEVSPHPGKDADGTGQAAPAVRTATLIDSLLWWEMPEAEGSSWDGFVEYRRIRESQLRRDLMDHLLQSF